MNKSVKAKLVRKALKLHEVQFPNSNTNKRVEFDAMNGEDLRSYIAFRTSMLTPMWLRKG